MKVAVVDTSALISIALSKEIDVAIQIALFKIPEEVKQELLEMSKFKDLEGKAAKYVLKLISKGKIKVTDIKNKNKAKLLVNKNVDLGEAACFILAEEQEIPILLMDDVSAAYSLQEFAKAKGITIKISAAVLIELIKTGKLTKKQGISALNKMIKNRAWEKGVLEYLITKYLKQI